MFQNYLKFFPDSLKLNQDGTISIDEKFYPLTNNIPRFVPNSSYSSGNFAKLREEFSKLQLDSVNGTSHRLKTVLNRTKWPSDYFKNKTVLECGCGAGPDTEILLKLGCTVVAVDLAGIDVAETNVGANNNVQFVQASIDDLPLKKASFDIVFCHRVIQHTPNSEKTLEHILSFVKPDGAVFVHSYSRSFYQMFRWKYFLRPITTRMNPDTLFNLISFYSRFFHKLTGLLKKNRLGKYFCWVFIPYMNYSHVPEFTNKNIDFLIDYGIHDTFDALSPKYDNPLRFSSAQKIAARILKARHEIINTKSMLLIRSVVE